MTKATASEKLPRQTLIDELERGPLGDKIRADFAKRRLLERQRLAQALADAEKSLLAELPELDAAIEAAIEGVRDAELRLAEARTTLSITRGAKTSAQFECEGLTRLYGGELRAGASPLVAEFRQWVRTELDKLPKQLHVDREIHETVAGRQEHVISNRAALVARQDGLLIALRVEIPLMEIEPEDRVVAERIHQIKSNLPAVTEIGGIEGYSP